MSEFKLGKGKLLFTGEDGFEVEMRGVAMRMQMEQESIDHHSFGQRTRQVMLPPTYTMTFEAIEFDIRETPTATADAKNTVRMIRFMKGQ